MSQFEREERYIVVKLSDMPKGNGDEAALRDVLMSRHIPTREGLVIEKDWPEYEPTWAAIERRVTGTVQWDGKGLPPVGTVCEYNNLEPHPVSTDLKWSPVHIVAHDTQGGEVFAVFSSLSGYHGNRRAECFRPIRTPGQIAAEERETRLTAMSRAYQDATGRTPDAYVSEAFRALEEAGYRKQVTP